MRSNDGYTAAAARMPSARPATPPASPRVAPRASTAARSWRGLAPTAVSRPRSRISRRTPAANAAAATSAAIIRASPAMTGTRLSTPLPRRLDDVPKARSRVMIASPSTPASTPRSATPGGSAISQTCRAAGPRAPRPVTARTAWTSAG
jgi:hypothetical protein